MFRRKGNEGGGGALIVAVGFAFAFEGGSFGGWDAGYFEEKIRDNDGSVEADPAIRRACGKKEDPEPDDRFEKVIGMAGVFP